MSVAGLAADPPAAEPQKAVLALYGSRPDLPANIIVDEIIRSTLERELGSSLDFYAEFLDTARWPEGETQAVVRDFLRRRYAQKKLSAIIAVARPAINFIRIYGDELFPAVPIVAYGDSEALRDWEPGRPITGTLGKVDIRGTVELILRLQPETREILVISGASASDQWLQSLARRQLEELQKNVKFTYFTGVAAGDLVRTGARAPDGTAILFLSMVQDSAGNKLLSHEVLVRIAKEARVPVYNHSAANVGFGIVGGVVFNPGVLGRETAQLTLRVLRGERVQDLPVQQSKSTVPMVDWQQMRRWGFSEKNLPPGTIVLNRQPTVWNSYKWYIVGAVCLLLVQTSLIVGLLWQRATRRKAEAARTESERRFRLVANTAPVMIWMSRTDKMCDYFNSPWLHFRGRTLELERGNGWMEGVHKEDLTECLKTYGEAFDKREQFEMQFRLRRRDGEYRWLLNIGVPRFHHDGTFAGYIGSCIDITERKRAEEALSTIGRRLIEAHEEERTWIGRELHDDINQKLAMLAIEMDRWSQEESQGNFLGHLRHARKQIMELSMDVQALSHRLHSSKLEILGLAVAAGSFCREVSEKAKVEVRFSHSAVPSTMPKEVSLCLFRVLQEALQNAIKYSGVTLFHVNLRGTSDGLQLTVSDEGKGFDKHQRFASEGLGLISMRERLQIVDGVLEIKTRPGGGTTILARVPPQTAELRAVAG